jgi:hypothetical protein
MLKLQFLIGKETEKITLQQQKKRKTTLNSFKMNFRSSNTRTKTLTIQEQTRNP